MRNIVCLLAAILILFSCRKSANNEINSSNNVQEIAGNWNAAYLGKSIRIAIDSPGNFSLVIPVIVKKESEAAPVTWEITCKGRCVRQSGSYHLRTDALAIMGQEAGSGADAKTLIEQSLSGVDITVQQTGISGEQLSARLALQDRELWLTRP